MLRTLVGGWDRNFARAGLLIRPVAMAALQAHLRTGHDVVLPQLTAAARPAGRDPGPDHRGRRPTPCTSCCSPTRHRGPPVRRPGGPDGWHDPVGSPPPTSRRRAATPCCGAYRDRIAGLAGADPDTLVLDTTGDGADASYAALLALLRSRFAEDAPDP